MTHLNAISVLLLTVGLFLPSQRQAIEAPTELTGTVWVLQSGDLDTRLSTFSRLRPDSDPKATRWHFRSMSVFVEEHPVHQGGQTIGTTDDVGLHAVQDRLHVHDLHATILWLMGLHHMELVYKYKGRPERPTLNEGEAYHKIAG